MNTTILRRVQGGLGHCNSICCRVWGRRSYTLQLYHRQGLKVTEKAIEETHPISDASSLVPRLSGRGLGAWGRGYDASYTEHVAALLDEMEMHGLRYTAGVRAVLTGGGGGGEPEEVVTSAFSHHGADC